MPPAPAARPCGSRCRPRTRVLRVLWTSRNCLEPNASLGIDHITLQVRVGLLTRSEDVSLQQAWALTGKK
ncbi:MAG: hypothetical protein ABJB47_22260 [Actinomycetota bacterium]